MINEAAEYYLYVNGKQLGPFAEPQISDMWGASALPADALCWKDGWEDWLPLKEVMLEKEQQKAGRSTMTQEEIKAHVAAVLENLASEGEIPFSVPEDVFSPGHDFPASSVAHDRAAIAETPEIKELMERKLKLQIELDSLRGSCDAETTVQRAVERITELIGSLNSQLDDDDTSPNARSHSTARKDHPDYVATVAARDRLQMIISDQGLQQACTAREAAIAMMRTMDEQIAQLEQKVCQNTASAQEAALLHELHEVRATMDWTLIERLKAYEEAKEQRYREAEEEIKRSGEVPVKQPKRTPEEEALHKATLARIEAQEQLKITMMEISLASQKNSQKTPLREILTGVGGCALNLCVMIGVIWVAGLFITGGASIYEKTYPWLLGASAIITVICVVVLLPLAAFRKTRLASGIGFYIASYFFGLTTWLWCLTLTFYIWGGGGTFLALILTGGTIAPAAFLACLFNKLWGIAGEIVLTVGLIFVLRFFGVYLMSKAGPKDAELYE